MSATIHEQGYRRWSGARRPTRAAVGPVARHALRHLLGIRRRARAKLIPWGLLAAASLPALGFTAVFLFAPPGVLTFADEVVPGPEVYLGGVTLLIYTGAALAGPTALCGDRRSGALAIYLASPLDRDGYLLGKAAAVAGFLSGICVAPLLLYLAGTMIAGAGPSGVGAVAVALVRALTAGGLVAAAFTALSVAAGTLTDRRGAAAGGVVLFVILDSALVGILQNALRLPDLIGLLDLNRVVLAAVLAVYGVDEGEFGPVTSVAAALAWTAGLGALARWRLAGVEVTR